VTTEVGGAWNRAGLDAVDPGVAFHPGSPIDRPWTAVDRILSFRGESG